MFDIDPFPCDEKADRENEPENVYEEYLEQVNEDMIDIEKLEISNTLTNDAADVRLVILNSRTAHKEMSQLCELPHGIKDHVDKGYKLRKESSRRPTCIQVTE